jgi:peptidoglycan/xylan/chitin deacetylase (PgdA/CDA1 family)
MYLVKTPYFLKTLFSDRVWDLPCGEKGVYLTFDDGPIPRVTPWVLDILKDYNFKATFFCVGENVAKNKSIYHRILDDGHSVGNHTYNHLNGWFTKQEDYLENIRLADEVINSSLFRPPYGKLRPKQSQTLKANKTIVMWDILSGDFDQNISAEDCLENVTNNYGSGSIIVFHDNIKTWEKLQIVLPSLFEHMAERGFTSHNLSFLNEAVEFAF